MQKNKYHIINFRAKKNNQDEWFYFEWKGKKKEKKFWEAARVVIDVEKKKVEWRYYLMMNGQWTYYKCHNGLEL